MFDKKAHMRFIEKCYQRYEQKCTSLHIISCIMQNRQKMLYRKLF